MQPLPVRLRANFGYLYNGSHMITNAERTGARYYLYRWHTDNPVTFTRHLKMTMEPGHANHRADNWYSVCYWYQSQPYTDFPALPPAPEAPANPLTVPAPTTDTSRSSVPS